MSLKLYGKTLIIQPYPGIGDMMWHLPQIRAIASAVDSGVVSILTKPRTLAQQWLNHDPIIDRIFYCEKNEILKTAESLKSEKFSHAFILHGSFTYGLIPFLAQIPYRYGYGFGCQKILLNQKPYFEKQFKTSHAIDLGEMYLERLGLNTRPLDRHLNVSKTTLSDTVKVFKSYPRPWMCFGVGASDESKKWPLDSFNELAKRIKEISPNATIFVLGAHHERMDIEDLIKKTVSNGLKNIVPVSSLSIDQVFALIKMSSLYIGNDSGLMNAAACLGVPTFGLFAVTRPLTYVDNLTPISIDPLKDMSSRRSEMSSITPQQVMGKIKTLLLTLNKRKDHAPDSQV